MPGDQNSRHYRFQKDTFPILDLSLLHEQAEDMSYETRTLTTDERLDWLRLYRSENVGPVTFFRLLEQFGSARHALEALPELARQGGSRRVLTVCSKAIAERELAAIEKLGATLLPCADPRFPPALRALETAPLLISIGHPHLLARTAVAIVGARNASAIGRRIAQTMAAELGNAGLLVVSGMARGIDAAAHRGALASGTVAVLAGGCDVVYPPENQALYEEIREAGCIVSEMPPGTQPQATHFPRRNRLISGMALGLVVIEASGKSGSLITARLAIDQGREIFAVPGSPMDPRAEGPNALIRQGATLTRNANDVLDILNDMLRRPLAERRPSAFHGSSATPLNEKEMALARKTIIQSLSPSPVTVDEIIRQCQLSPAVVSMVLLELELAGRLERHPGNQVSLLSL